VCYPVDFKVTINCNKWCPRVLSFSCCRKDSEESEDERVQQVAEDSFRDRLKKFLEKERKIEEKRARCS
jgi:hypothetical protein